MNPICLTDIILEEVPINAFRDGEAFSKHNTPLYDDNIYALVRNPIISQNYSELIVALLDIPSAHNVSVRNGKKGWIRAYPNERTNDSKIDELAKIASLDSRKRHYFELQISNPQEHRRYQAVIEFAQTPTGLIIGSKVTVPKSKAGLFTVKRRGFGPYEKINGVWPYSAKIEKAKTPLEHN